VGRRAREVADAPTPQRPPTTLAGGAVGASRLLTPAESRLPHLIDDTVTSSLLAGMLTVIDRQLYCSLLDELSHQPPPLWTLTITSEQQVLTATTLNIRVHPHSQNVTVPIR